MADPPRRPRAPGTDVSLPPPASEETDERVLWQTEERDRRDRRLPPPQARRRAPDVVPESVAPPPSKRTVLPPGTPWWGYLLLALISTGAGGGIVGALQRKGPSSEQIEDMRSEIRLVSADVREIRDHLRKQARVDSERWDLVAAAICRINGGPWVRGVPCAEVEFEPLPLGVVHVGPKFRARAEWPIASRPP